MTDNHDTYDLVIVGGGPAALAELLRLQSENRRILVVSDKFGGCMDVLGELRLQSYLPEVMIAGAPCDLREFMHSKTEDRPTGREYTTYIRACYETVRADKLTAQAMGLSKPGAQFVLDVACATGPRRVMADRIVLATGIRSKALPLSVPPGKRLPCFDAYRRIAAGDIDAFNRRDICVIGSGNTAFQLAHALSRVAKSITILAKEYVGFYPMETANCFGLRAPSLQTLELVEKTASGVAQAGPINHAGYELAPTFLHIYDSIAVDDSFNLVARIPVHLNQHPTLQRSLASAAQRTRLHRTSDDAYSWNAPSQDLIIISAIGVEANVLETPWPDLVDRHTGFIRHDAGKTCVEGLYVTGCAAGYKSINRMQCASLRL